MSDVTYGALLADAERHLVRAIFTTHVPFQSAPQARHAAEDYTQILLALKGGVRTLAGVATPEEQRILPPPQSLASQLFIVLGEAVSRFTGTTEARSRRSEWNATARAISAATSLLASHLGPDRAHRTPDAALLDNEETRQGGLLRLAVFALTAAEGGRPLAFRVQDASIRFQQPGRLRLTADWLMEAQAAVGAAAATVITTLGRATRESNLSFLRPAPLLMPTRDTDPLVAARKSFDRVRLVAHRQGRGELGAGMDAIRAYATVGMLVATHSHAILAAVSEMRRGDTVGRREELISCARAVLDMRRAWADLLNVTEQCATTSHSPALLGREVACLSDSLASVTRHASRWRPPAEIVPTERAEQQLLHLIHHMGSRLPDVAAAARVVTEQLYERGELLGPTREREDLDLPYRWSPISSQRLAALRATGRAVQAASGEAAAATGLLLRLTTPLGQRMSAVSTSAFAKRRPIRRSTGM